MIFDILFSAKFSAFYFGKLTFEKTPIDSTKYLNLINLVYKFFGEYLLKYWHWLINLKFLNLSNVSFLIY